MWKTTTTTHSTSNLSPKHQKWQHWTEVISWFLPASWTEAEVRLSFYFKCPSIYSLASVRLPRFVTYVSTRSNGDASGHALDAWLRQVRIGVALQCASFFIRLNRKYYLRIIIK